MVTKIPKKIFARQHQITAEFLKHIDKHLTDVLDKELPDMFEIRDVADLMHIHPTHLSNTIKLTTGKSPCFFFEEKIMVIAKEMLSNNDTSIATVARRLTFDPSNFTKFFKRFEGITPKQYREEVLMEKTETVTI
jgi:AraC family transcriptional regulator of adaptative response / methylphosphotriester-DNA alkyltransferase methyltransferase